MILVFVFYYCVIDVSGCVLWYLVVFLCCLNCCLVCCICVFAIWLLSIVVVAGLFICELTVDG